MTLSGMMMVTAFVLFGVASDFIQYCAASVIAGIGYGTGAMIPVAILISRWFSGKKDTAMGICSAVTGVSTLGIPSLISKSIENAGLKTTFIAEACIMGIFVFLCGCLLRNSPEDMNMLPYGAEEKEAAYEDGKKNSVSSAGHDMSVSGYAVMIPVLLLIGAVMNVSYSHLTVLITGENLSADTAALAMSVSGISLMAGKILYGRLEDKWGSSRCNMLFGPVFLAGMLLFCFLGRSHSVLFPAMVMYSFGMAYMSVGLSTWPSELSSEKGHDRLVQIFQIGYAGGSLLFSPLPGIMADRAGGSYIPVFALFTVFAAIVLLAAQILLIRHGKQ